MARLTLVPRRVGAGCGRLDGQMPRAKPAGNFLNSTISFKFFAIKKGLCQSLPNVLPVAKTLAQPMLYVGPMPMVPIQESSWMRPDSQWNCSGGICVLKALKFHWCPDGMCELFADFTG